MSDRRKQIINTASDIFIRYGPERTTMSEIAKASGVSRPTLYSFFSCKEDIISAAITLFNETTVANIKIGLASTNSLSGALDVFFDNAVIKVFQLMQQWPDVRNFLSEDNQITCHAYEAALQNLNVVMQQILTPYTKQIEAKGISLEQYSAFIIANVSKLKRNVTSQQKLDGLLNALKISVLSVADALD